MSLAYQIVDLTESPSQETAVVLGQQSCRIRIYTKSINVVKLYGGQDIDPPVYVNTQPVFMDLLVTDAPIIMGVLCRSGVKMVRDAYLGFKGDLAIYDTWASAANPPKDPQGVSFLLPPMYLRNDDQLALPLELAGRAPSTLAGKIPGLGTRWQLTYWPATT